MRDFVFTSEAVTEGHPDKLCDQIGDAIVDRFLQQDPCARIYAECAVSTGVLFIAARFSAAATVDIPQTARQVIETIGYNPVAIDPRSCSVLTSLQETPPDEGACFDERRLDEAGIESVPARNQVTVFGFACDQTPALMPLPIWLAHQLARRLVAARYRRELPYLAPDGRTQVGVEYRGNRAARIHGITVVASQERGGQPSPERLRRDIRDAVIDPVFREEPVRPDRTTRVFINPDGPVVAGGPSLHSGLTGRQNAVDTYGGWARHGGAALSGKDPLRIDRTGAYAARWAAKNVVAAGLAAECEVNLSYAIGLARPASLQVCTFGTGVIPDERLQELVARQFDFRPAAILRQFSLRRLPGLLKGGFYRKLASYGHVGRMDIGLPWEITDRAAALRESAGFGGRIAAARKEDRP